MNDAQTSTQLSLACSQLQLPLEVWERVFDEINTEAFTIAYPRLGLWSWSGWYSDTAPHETARRARNDLLACSMVCKAWTPRCLWNMHEYLAICSESHLKNLSEQLRSSAIHRSRVRAINIDAKRTPYQAWILQVPMRLPLDKMNVQSLSLSHVDLRTIHAAFYQIMSRFKPLADLYFIKVRYSHYSQLTRLAVITKSRYFDLEDCIKDAPGSKPQNTGVVSESLSLRKTFVVNVMFSMNWKSFREMSRNWFLPSTIRRAYLPVHADEDDCPLDDAQVWQNIAQLFVRMCAQVSIYGNDSRIKVELEYTKGLRISLQRGEESEVISSSLSRNILTTMSPVPTTLLGDRTADKARRIVEVFFSQSDVAAVARLFNHLSSLHFDSIVFRLLKDPNGHEFYPEHWSPIDDALANPGYQNLERIELLLHLHQAKDSRLLTEFECVVDLYPVLLPKLSRRIPAAFEPCLSNTCRIHE